MNRRKIKKNRIALKIWTAVTRVEKYNTCAAIQIIVTICFISFCDDSFTWGKSNLRRLIYERSATNIRDWSLAYSFIYVIWVCVCSLVICVKNGFPWYIYLAFWTYSTLRPKLNEIFCRHVCNKLFPFARIHSNAADIFYPSTTVVNFCGNFYTIKQQKYFFSLQFHECKSVSYVVDIFYLLKQGDP